MAARQPAAPVRVEETIKKSRFIGILTPVPTEAAFKAELAARWAEHPHASHICYAYRIQSDSGLVLRFADDNEPAGTAGKPIFQHLEGNDLVNTALLVVRYFGGVKLGAGGLVRAYGGTARAAIEAATLVPYKEYTTLRLSLPYARLAELEYQLGKWDAAIVDRAFAADVCLAIRIEKSILADLQPLLATFGGLHHS